MKLFFKKITSLALICLISTNFCQVFATDNNINLNIGYIESYGVVTSADGLEHVGYFVDYVNTILKYTKNNYNVNWISMSYDSIYHDLDNEIIDIMLPSRAHPNLSDDYILTNNSIGSNMIVLVAKESEGIIFHDLSKINDSVIGVRENYMYIDVLSDFLENNNLTPEILEFSHDNYENGALYGTYDYCLANSMHITKGFQVVATLDNEPIYILAHKNSQNIIDDLDFAINLATEMDFFFQEKLYINYFDHLLNSNNLITADDYNLLLDVPSYNLGYSPTYSPLTYLNDNGQLVGIAVEMLNAMVRETGITLNWIDVTTLEPDELDQIDISLMAPNYSNNKFKANQTIPYFYYPYVLVDNYDSVEKANKLGILNFYEIDTRTLDIITNNGDVEIYPNFASMESAFFDNEISSMIVTNMVYNKMRNAIKSADYLVTPIDAKLDITLAFSDDFPKEKIDIFNKLIIKLDSVEMEYLFSEHVTYSSNAEVTTLSFLKQHWQVFSVTFVMIFTTILLILLAFITSQKKKLINSTITSHAIISCAQTLSQGQDAHESLNALLEIISNYYKSEVAYIQETDPLYVSEKSGIFSFAHANILIDDFSVYPCIHDDEASSNLNQLLSECEYIFLEQGDPTLANYYPYNIFLLTNKNLLIVPINIQGKFSGILGLANLEENVNNFELVTTVTAFIANNLEIVYSKHILENSVESLKRTNRESDAIFECVKTLIYNDNLTDAIHKLLSVLCKYFDAERTFILDKKDDNLEIYGEYLAHQAIRPSVANNHKLSYDAILKWFNELSVDNIMITKNAFIEIPEWLRDVSEYQLIERGYGFIATPLYQNGEIAGFLWVDNSRAKLEDFTMLRTISAFIDEHWHKHKLTQELEKMSYSDKLTGLYNRNFYTNYINRSEPYKNFGIIFADVNGLKTANDKIGHEFGDLLLRWSALFLKTYAGDLVFRIGGDEFVCFIENTKKSDFDKIVTQLNTKIKDFGDVHLSIGAIWDELVTDVEKNVVIADQLMYVSKQEYYAQKAKDPRSQDELLESFKLSISNLKLQLENGEIK